MEKDFKSFIVVVAVLMIIDLLYKFNYMLKPNSKHFTLYEFRSKDINGHIQPPIKYWRNVQNMMDALEIIRTELGNKPIIINSAYRTGDHNTKVNGSAKSQHLQAKAVDIYVQGVSPAVVYATIEKLINAKRIPQGGLGKYGSFTHYDLRGSKSRWTIS